MILGFPHLEAGVPNEQHQEGESFLSVEGGSLRAQSLTVYHNFSQKAGPTSVTVTVGPRPCATFVYTCSLNFPFLPKLFPQFPKQNLSSGIYVLSQVCWGERKWRRNLHNEKSPAQPTTRHYTDNKRNICIGKGIKEISNSLLLHHRMYNHSFPHSLCPLLPDGETELMG